MSETIYVSLLDEGTVVWRPVPAHRIAEGRFIVLRPADYNELDEVWQFPPGSVVTTADRATSEGHITAAVALAEAVLRSA